MKRQQLLLLILAFGVFSILNTEMGILPMAAAMYQVDIVQAGMLVSLFALGVAIAGPTMPLLFSRFNRKHVMLLVLGVFTICNALAVVASDFRLLLVLRVVPAFFHPVYCLSSRPRPAPPSPTASSTRRSAASCSSALACPCTPAWSSACPSAMSWQRRLTFRRRWSSLQA